MVEPVNEADVVGANPTLLDKGVFVIEKYRKKNIAIEAVQWNGENVEEIYNFCNNKSGKYVSLGNGVLRIETLKSLVEASLGDYVIKGVNGEFYSCKSDTFKRTYEKV